MLLYYNQNNLRIMCQQYGSVVLKRSTLCVAFFVALLTLGMQLYQKFAPDAAPDSWDWFLDKNGMAIMNSFVVFGFVFRVNLAWNRYWEAITNLHLMYSEWEEAFSQSCAFIRSTIAKAKSDEKFEKVNRLRCMERILHNDFLLLSACAADRVLKGDASRLRSRSNYEAWDGQIIMRRAFTEREDGPALNMPEFVSMSEMQEGLGRRKSTDTSLTRRSRPDSGLLHVWSAVKLPLNHLPTQGQIELLDNTIDRSCLAMFWLYDHLSSFSNHLAIGLPIQSRLYQELSNGYQRFQNIVKIADVPFPFPHAQLMLVILIGWLGFVPLYIASSQKSLILGPLMAFLIATAGWSFNLCAKEMEDPLGLDANDVSVQDFHLRFVEALEKTHEAFESADIVEEELFRTVAPDVADDAGHPGNVESEQVLIGNKQSLAMHGEISARIGREELFAELSASGLGLSSGQVQLINKSSRLSREELFAEASVLGLTNEQIQFIDKYRTPGSGKPQKTTETDLGPTRLTSAEDAPKKTAARSADTALEVALAEVSERIEKHLAVITQEICHSLRQMDLTLPRDMSGILLESSETITSSRKGGVSGIAGCDAPKGDQQLERPGQGPLSL